MKNNSMEIPASLTNLKKLLKNSSLDLIFLTPCLELKTKWLYGMSLAKKRLRKYYLTMYLREAYAIFKETRQEDEEMCSLSVLCKL